MYEYIGILLGARPILHISRIKVKQSMKVYAKQQGNIQERDEKRR
jgi:hypothetical protein